MTSLQGDASVSPRQHPNAHRRIAVHPVKVDATANATRSPGLPAFALMILLCATWGYQQVRIKIASEGVSAVRQAGLRSATALLLTLWARWPIRA